MYTPDFLASSNRIDFVLTSYSKSSLLSPLMFIELSAIYAESNTSSFVDKKILSQITFVCAIIDDDKPLIINNNKTICRKGTNCIVQHLISVR